MTATDAAPGRIGLLIVNLGTPDAAEPKAVKRYLRQFLSDPRVVEIPQLVWQPILRGVILNVRPRKSAHAYAQVWGAEGSPLATITRDTARRLEGMFGDNVIVDWAMRYGNPSIENRLEALIAQGCDRILFAPLYPQYCAATTASAHDALFAAIARRRVQPAIRTLPPYWRDPIHIEALKSSIERQLGTLAFAPDLIVASFHGMPKRTTAKGDPYYYQCLETANLLQDALGREVRTTFQSRFGPDKWLEPATDLTLAALPKQGVRKVAVVMPGFSADCIETLEEIAMQGRESFMEAGGEAFAALECLNASDESVAMLHVLLGRELSGWENF